MVATMYLPDDLAEVARQLVSNGEYADTDAVIRDAFELLEQQRESACRRQSIVAGNCSIDEGE